MNLNESCIQLLELIQFFCASLLPQEFFWDIYISIIIRHKQCSRYQCKVSPFYYISLVCQVKNGLCGAAGLSHQPPSLFFPSHLHSCFSFFFLLLSSSCLPFSPLPCEIILIWIHTLHATRHNLHTGTHTHIYTHSKHRQTLGRADFIAVFIHTVFICCDADWVMS